MILQTPQKTTLDNIKYPPIIYKYREINNPEHRTIITDQVVFLAPPNTFLDPLDCKNPTRYDLLTKDEIFEEYVKLFREMNPNWSQTQIRNQARIYSKKDLLNNSSRMSDMDRRDETEFNKRIGIFCMTANFSSDFMWKGYSDNYNGFCIGFNSKILFQKLGGGGRIFYEHTLPIIHPRDSFQEKYIKQIFFKLKKWQDEEEYRTVQMWKPPFDTNMRKVKVPKEAFCEILIGENVSEFSKNELIAQASAVNPNIVIQIASHDNNKAKIKNYV